LTSRRHPTAASSIGVFATEADRIEAAQNGNTVAFNQLVIAYQELAFNVALRLVGNADTAADVTQDAFLSAYRHLDQFKGGSFRSWLLRIVTNASYDVLRSAHHKKGQSLDELTADSSFDLPDPGGLPESITIRRELVEKIQAGISTLPLDQRAVLVLYDIHGLSYEEIAASLDINLGTVKSRLSRARFRLRDYLMQHPELWKE
jgi:RNA polymerase sigma-70 factor (ECF subfamily)